VYGSKTKAKVAVRALTLGLPKGVRGRVQLYILRSSPVQVT